MSIQIKDLTLLIVNPWVDSYAELISGQFPDLNIIKSKLLNEENEAIDGDINGVNIILSFTPLRRSQPKMKNLKWFQALSAGVEHITSSGVLSRDVLLTNAAGVASIGISEFVISVLMAFAKKIPMLVHNQAKKEWSFWCSNELHGKTIGILGLGHLGQPIARTAKLGFDMRVVAYDKYVTEYEYADLISSELMDILAVADFLVVTLPLNEGTANLFGEEQFKAMKRNAFFMNVARGEIVVKEALLKALKEKWIAGVGLDVYWGADPSEMILRPDDELWEFDNVIISPHTAWFSENYAIRAADLFNRNLQRFVNQEPLINAVKW